MDLVAFYQGEAPDYQGRTLREIWGWDDERLEEQHDYIQVLFPLKELSQFNSARALYSTTPRLPASARMKRYGRICCNRCA